jgi:secretion/DNA translocation related TadE-like protein
MTARWRREQRGAATVLVLPFVGVLALVTVVLAFQGGVLVTQRRVQAAADLAALAGAAALQRGQDGCAAASAVAGRNGARLSDCQVSGVAGRDVVVTAERDGPAVLGRSVTVEASARAGPGP